MRIVVAVDWTDQSFSAVKEVVHLYSPDELILVHAVDLGILDYPTLAPAMGDAVYQDVRKAMMDAGHQLLERTAGLVPPSISTVKRICDVGSPETVILDVVHSTRADLVVTGARGRGRIAELILGSISHRVLSKATCPTLLVKGQFRTIQRLLVAVESTEDAERIMGWLLAHPFNRRVEVSVISVTPAPPLVEPDTVANFAIWSATVKKFAQELADGVAAKLDGRHYAATSRTVNGEPVEVILQESTAHDLVVVGSHGRTGLDRVLLGSVSHAVVHGADCPVLVIR